MILDERDGAPDSYEFDIAVVAVGYEQRCRWVAEQCSIAATNKIGLTFGFLEEGSFVENASFFQERGFALLNGLAVDSLQSLEHRLKASLGEVQSGEAKLLIDISSMSREMIANVALAISRAAGVRPVRITVAYSPSKFLGKTRPAPIRIARPIKPELAGWSSRPELPLAVVAGLGCEPGLALGALQFLEPDRAWLYYPVGVDLEYDSDMRSANEHLDEIFDVSKFEYDITSPTILRGKVESLLRSVQDDFRIIMLPFGPKMFAWASLSTVVFGEFRGPGVWTFSARDHALVVDRAAEGPIIWYSCLVAP